VTEGARRIARVLAPLAVSGLLLAALAFVFDPAETIAHLKAMSPGGLAGAVALLIACFMLGTARFTRAAVRASGKPAPRFVTLWATPLSLLAILLAHGVSLLCETVRVQYLVRRLHIDLKDAVFVSLGDRLFGGASSALVAAICLTVFPNVPTPLRLASGAVAIAGVVILLAIALQRLPANALLDRIGMTRRRLDFFVADLPDAGFQMMIATVSSMAIGLAIYVLARDMGAEAPLGICLLGAPIIYCGISFPLTFAGWGAREAAHILVFAWTGFMTVDQAVAVSLALGGCIFAAAVPGLIWPLMDASWRRPVKLPA
jgi:uncharacterized membrane protein YbhN (UPF0104 family)